MKYLKRNKMKYLLVRTSSANELEQQVNSLIKIGWTPQGGIALSDNGLYAQAMIKSSI
jgi:hypothetical protein